MSISIIAIDLSHQNSSLAKDSCDRGEGAGPASLVRGGDSEGRACKGLIFTASYMI